MAAILFPNIDPVLLRIGPMAVRYYGIAYVLAFVAAGLVLRVLNERWELGLSADDQLEVLLAAVLGVIIGARVGYVLVYNPAYYLKHPLEASAIWDGGMSFHGGLVGIVLAAVVEGRRLKVAFLRLTDVGAVAAPVGFFFGRLANFINDELWGRVTTVPWAFVFPAAGPQPRHPSQLYEAALEGVVLFAVMLLLARRRRSDGELLGWLLVLYGCFRIFVELFREPDAQLGFIFRYFTTGQLLSVPMVLLGAWLLWRVRRPAKE